MAEFCEECPLRGNCQGDITGLVQAVAARGRVSGGIITAEVGAFKDSEGRLSGLIRVPHDESEQTLLAAIDGCEYPLYETKGFWVAKKQIVTCRALGEYMLTDKKLAESAQRELSWRKNL
jgi:hypothetical protein